MTEKAVEEIFKSGFGADSYTGEGREVSPEEQRISEELSGTRAEDLWENVEGAEVPKQLQEDLDSGVAGVLFWRALIMPVRPTKKSKGGIILVPESQENAQYLTYIGRVIALGPLWCRGPSFDAYGEAHAKFMLEAIKPGDWVIYGRHAGQRVEYRGVKFLLVNDDEKLMKIASPEGWRIYS